MSRLLRMTPERWIAIKEIFQAALDVPRDDQRPMVHARCGEDAEAEREVLRLLMAHGDSADFLEEPVAKLSHFLPPLTEEPMLRAEQMIARRFRVIRFLSRGGMGEVYEAWDAELQEAVALKTIRSFIASEATVIERFKREVKHAREISHPNICRVHELFREDVDGVGRVWLLSMELLPGETLLQRIRARGAIGLDEALGLARQMVDGLGAAHAVGLVHRDFKSANVMLVESAGGGTRAVITDFGLASKVIEGDLREREAGAGTPGYMAPEQIETGDVGPLADQYALGVVLCEMVTGAMPVWAPQRGASGKTLVLKLPPGRMGVRWATVIRRCLAQRPEDRFSRIAEVTRALEDRGVLARTWKVAVALLLVASLTAGGVLWLRREKACRICDLVQLTPETDESESPSLARSGHMIAYSSDRGDRGNLDIFVQRVPGGRPQRLTTDPARDGDPSLAPDGRTVYFRSERDGGGVYRTGGADVPSGERKDQLVVARGRNPQISPDGKRLLYWTGDADPGVASGKIFLRTLDGGAVMQLARSFADARYPTWSPDGRSVLFSGCEGRSETMPGCMAWWVSSADGLRLSNTHAMERLRAADLALSRPGPGSWYSGGVLFSGGVKGVNISLWSLPLDPESWQVKGAPTQLLEEPARDLGPSLAADRSVAYTRISGALHIWQIQVGARPGEWKMSKVTDDAEIDGSPFVSEGGRWLVFGRGRGSNRSLWMRDNTTGAESRLFSSGKPTQSPIVDPSGRVLVYEEVDDDVPSIYLRRPGEGPMELCHGCSVPSGWFDGDRSFLYRDGLPAVIKMMDPRTQASRVLLKEDGASLGDATWSPANEHLLFTETRGGSKRMFAVRLPRATGAVVGDWIEIPEKAVSPDHPRWSGDGRTIFYVSNEDGFSCLYGWTFSPEKEAVVGQPFALAHFHNERSSIANVYPHAFNLSAGPNSVYFNLGEQNSTIWMGSLRQ